MLKKKSHAGRKMFDGKGVQTVVAKLEQAFELGFTDEEASLHAGISKNALYRYIEKNPKFRDRKELLKKSPKLKAKINVSKRLENDPNGEFSLKYLERTDDAFNPRTKLDHRGKIDIPTVFQVINPHGDTVPTPTKTA